MGCKRQLTRAHNKAQLNDFKGEKYFSELYFSFAIHAYSVMETDYGL